MQDVHVDVGNVGPKTATNAPPGSFGEAYPRGNTFCLAASRGRAEAHYVSSEWTMAVLASGGVFDADVFQLQLKFGRVDLAADNLGAASGICGNELRLGAAVFG